MDTVQFVKTSISGLYERDASEGWIGVICGCGTALPDCQSDQLTLAQAWDIADAFVFAPRSPVDLQSFKEDVCRYVPIGIQTLLWMEDADGTDQIMNCVHINVDSTRKRLSEDFSFIPGQGIKLGVSQGYAIRVEGESLVIKQTADSDPNIVFSPGEETPFAKVLDNRLDLPMAGPAAGTLRFTLQASNQRFFSEYHLGFCYHYGDPVQSCLYPMINPLDVGVLNFLVALDPNDLCNMNSPERMLRTYIAHDSSAELPSFYRTQWGGHITLSPYIQYADIGIRRAPLKDCARFVFSPVEIGNLGDPLYLVPEGAFHIQLTSMLHKREPVKIQLLGGLSGVETIELVPAFTGYAGDALVFESMHGAYSNVVPSTDNAELPTLTSRYVTSWATVIRLDKQDELVVYPIRYLSQPEEESWFEPRIGSKSCRQLYQPTVALLDSSLRSYFPHVPLSGITGLDEWKELKLERSVLSPLRKQVHDKIFFQQEAMGLLAEQADKYAATPQGLLLKVLADDRGWSELLLAKNTMSGRMEELKISSVSAEFKAAMLTDQLFLVVSLKEHLMGFTEQIPIADWPFRIQIPTALPGNGSFSNVLIFKFCQGKTMDLVKDLSLWTKPEMFNPASRPDELTGLSAWLQERCKTGKDLEWFNRAMNDPNWNGILAFDVNLTPSALPRSLKCLMGGIDEKKFIAHHVGIQMNRVKTGAGAELEIEDVSSMFAHINYLDGEAAPLSGSWRETDFGFRVTKLEVLFENSRINRFDAKLELSVHQLFGITTTEKKIMKFDGKLEQHNGVPTYVFYTDSALNMELDNDILTRVELSKATLETTKDDGTSIEARFSFHSALHFGEFKPDVFSFGGEGSSKLSLSNLGVCMAFTVDSLRAAAVTSFRFDAKDVLLDLIQSAGRSSSLMNGFPLQLTRLLTDAHPDRLQQEGYYPISVTYDNELRTRSDLPEEWYGIECSLNLGSLGSLSTQDSLVGKIAFCWNNLNQRHVGIQIPGIKPGSAMLAFQQIINTSFNDIRLANDAASYSLIIDNISQNFLGQPLEVPEGSDKLVLFKGTNDSATASDSIGWYAAYKK